MKSRLLGICAALSLIVNIIAVPASALEERGASIYSNIKIGDYIELGHYLGEPIVWRCVGIDEHGPLMLSDKVLCLKAYDAKGDSDTHYVPGQFSDIRKYYGSNCWSDSNLREWLNSDEESISWSHDSPSSDNVYNGYNAYDSEAGFLTCFTDEELSYISDTTQKVYTNQAEFLRNLTDGGNSEYLLLSGQHIQDLSLDFSDIYYQYVTDKFFVPNIIQLMQAYSNIGEDYIIAYPTKQAVTTSNFTHPEFSENMPCAYWINHPGVVGYSYEHMNTIGRDGNMSSTKQWDDNNEGAYISTVGVRPAFYLNTDNDNPEDDETLDSDGDGIPDIWEIYGVDTDGDGTIDLPLNEMGADPHTPDIFVEVDWMIQPEKYFLGICIQQEINLAPSESAMRLVYEAFKDHGINLHIDAGPSSIDFVTGKTWGKLSEGNEIPNEKNFKLGEKWEHWNEVAGDNFPENRRRVFRHCMFVNQYNGGTSSGKANGIPGQYFIVANQEWVRDTGDLGVAGTFMHELGHTLGLCHGGYDHEGNRTPDINNMYKPNYLSIMNYLFQTTGLAGTHEINYSEYTLPDLDEESLSEQNGIDPDGITDGTGLGTKLNINIDLRWFKEIPLISRTSVDFNGWWGIEDSPVSVDLNKDGEKTVLTGTEDWSHIVYAGGAIGNSNSLIDAGGINAPQSNNNDELNELSLEVALEAGVLGNLGSGAIEALGPHTLLTDTDLQTIYIRVKNMSSEPVEFTLQIDGNEICESTSLDVSVAASLDKVSYVDVPIPIKNTDIDGEYIIKAKLLYSDNMVTRANFPVTILEPTQEILNAIKTLIEDNSIGLPEIVLDEYVDIYNNFSTMGYTITFDPNGGIVTPVSVTTSGNGVLSTLPTPTRTGGYRFDGWYTAPLGGILITPNYVFNSNTTVYAHWVNDSMPEKPGVPVTGIELSTQKINLNRVGDVYQIEADVTPINATNKAVMWASSNPGVASVTQAGLVIAVSNGVTTITATTQDGGYTDNCEVRVELPEAPNVPVTDVELNTQRITLSRIGTSYQLKADVMPANATNQSVTWASSNPNVATVTDAGLVTAVSEGTAIITVTTEDGQKVATCTVTVRIESGSGGTGGGGSSGSTTPTSYAITAADTVGGAITISPKAASKGQTVTITAAPDEGFTLKTLSVSDKNGNKIELTQKNETSYTFKMPASKVTVSATFTEIVVEPEPVVLPFDDILQSAWYYGAVEYVYSNDMMQGTSATTFSPEVEMSRSMIATVLYRLANTPTQTGSISFGDVRENEWYTDAIQWAAENGIMEGYGNNQFGPMDNVTREQLALIFYNYTASKGISVTTTGDLSAFHDAQHTSDWAEEAISWAVGVGLLSGKGNGILDPTGTATRAEVAQILMNYCTKVM